MEVRGIEAAPVPSVYGANLRIIEVGYSRVKPWKSLKIPVITHANPKH
jgi:hypothetical protein